MAPAADPHIVSELAAIIRADVSTDSAPVVAEWSQVGTAHAGRIYVGEDRRPLSTNADGLFRRLREQMRDEETGVWLSARFDLDTGKFEPNYADRVYWNATGTSMLTKPEDPAVPTDADWQAELRRHPRADHHMPVWVAPSEHAGRHEFIQLRQGLTRMGFPLEAVRLPGEDHVTFEGALLIREQDWHMFSLDIFDYGQVSHLATEQGARAAGVHAWNYLTSPLPAAVAMPRDELARRHEAAAGGYRELTARIDGGGSGGVSTNLAAGVPFDRWGGIDGLYLFAWNTPMEARSLPPSATTNGAPLVTVIANRPVPAQVERARAWFDQPGGGVRFRLQAPVRDLIREGSLSMVHIH